MSEPSIQIFLADEQSLIIKAFSDLLNQVEGMAVVGHAQCGEEVLEKIEQINADVLLLELSFSDRSGLDVLTEVKKKKPNVAVLILTRFPEEQFAVQAIKLGAAGYLTKDVAYDMLLEAIRKVAKGEMYISSSVAKEMAHVLDDEHKTQQHLSLTRREVQVMCLIASGLALPQIAEKLGISMKTVSVHRANILEKMHLKNNVEITRYAIKHHLIPA